MEYLIKYSKYTANILLWIISLICIKLFISSLLPIILPFIIGWLIASLVNPIIKFFEKKNILKRKFMSGVFVATVITVIVLIVYYIFAVMIREMLLFFEQVPYMANDLATQFANADVKLEKILEMLPIKYKRQILAIIPALSKNLVVYAQDGAKSVLENASSLATKFPSAIFTLIVTLISIYFMLVDRDNILEFTYKYVPSNIKNAIKKYSVAFKGIVSGYFYAQFKIMFLIFLVLVCGFYILKINFAIPLAILIAFLDFLPLLGTGFVMWPWIALEIFYGNYYIAIGLGIIYLVTQLLRRIIEPKILGDAIGLNPFVAIVLMYIGYKTSSIFGVILAVPIGMLIINLNKATLFDDLKFIVKDIYNDFIALADINVYKK